MILKLGTIMTHIGHTHPESCPWECVHALDVDVELGKQSVHKLYFDFVRNGPDGYSEYYDVFFVPNETKYGNLFSIKYGTKVNE